MQNTFVSLLIESRQGLTETFNNASVHPCVFTALLFWNELESTPLFSEDDLTLSLVPGTRDEEVYMHWHDHLLCILSYLFFEITTMSGSESTTSIREELQQYISPFARIGTTSSSNILGDLAITLRRSNNVYPISFRQRQSPYKGKFNYRNAVDHATKFIFQHSSGQNLTYGMVERAVSSFITQSLQDYEKKKSLEARLKSSSRSNFKPDACHMVIRIHKGSQITDRLENHHWHVDNLYKPESPGDVNSLYAVTFLGKPTLVLKPQSTLPPSLQKSKGSQKGLHRTPNIFRKSTAQ
ncbi:hypothetical protein HYALB_00003907 [Hymenoscyphus albidus]|uniref:Uncharacterized protein n=1 Tax=Hymenoscyphus albidus TaxID=595503 RepID=A0A9N9LW40_9HELO|nr:hypothetical protein HYALB_00003907 [Hymenoscyphus albidus]